MTRAAHRILDRARSSAWRRVGIPIAGNKPAAPKAAPPAGSPDEKTGQNVASPPADEAGTGRPGAATPDANADQ